MLRILVLVACAWVVAMHALLQPRMPVFVAEVPRIFVVDQFATAAELADVVRLSQPHMVAAEIGNHGQIMQGNSRSNTDRSLRDATSHTLHPETWTPRIKELVDRMDAVSMCPGYGQHLTVSSYELGGHYQLHPDSSIASGRVATLILFLHEPEEGGELIFPWARLCKMVSLVR